MNGWLVFGRGPQQLARKSGPLLNTCCISQHSPKRQKQEVLDTYIQRDLSEGIDSLKHEDCKVANIQLTTWRQGPDSGAVPILL